MQPSVHPLNHPAIQPAIRSSNPPSGCGCNRSLNSHALSWTSFSESGGTLRHSQASCEISSLQRVLALPQVLFPVGHVWNTSLGKHPENILHRQSSFEFVTYFIFFIHFWSISMNIGKVWNVDQLGKHFHLSSCPYPPILPIHFSFLDEDRDHLFANRFGACWRSQLNEVKTTKATMQSRTTQRLFTTYPHLKYLSIKWKKSITSKLEASSHSSWTKYQMRSETHTTTRDTKLTRPV